MLNNKCKFSYLTSCIILTDDELPNLSAPASIKFLHCSKVLIPPDALTSTLSLATLFKVLTCSTVAPRKNRYMVLQIAHRRS